MSTFYQKRMCFFLSILMLKTQLLLYVIFQFETGKFQFYFPKGNTPSHRTFGFLVITAIAHGILP